jgi:hypothetical protein
MLVKTKINTNVSVKNKNTKISNLSILSEPKTKTSLKDLFKYFTLNIPEVIMSKADTSAIEKSKQEIKKGDYLTLDELILKMKSK